MGKIGQAITGSGRAAVVGSCRRGGLVAVDGARDRLDIVPGIDKGPRRRGA